MADERVNRVSVDLDVTGEPRVEAAFQRARDNARQYAADVAAVSADPFAELERGAKLSEDAWHELDLAVEQSFVRTSRSAKSLSAEFAATLQGAQREALALQRAGSQLSGSFFGGVADQGTQVEREAAELQQRFAALYQQLREGRPLFELNRELEDARLRLSDLRQTALGLQSLDVTGRSAASAYRGLARESQLAEKEVERVRRELEQTRTAAQALEVQFARIAATRQGTPLGAMAAERAAGARRLTDAAEAGLGNLERGMTAQEFERLSQGAATARQVLGGLRQESHLLRRELAQEVPEGHGLSTFALRHIIQGGAGAVGLPGEFGGLAALGAFGPMAAAAAGGLALAASARELIKLDAELEHSQLDLAVSARDTGESFAQANRDAELFRTTLEADREEAMRVAAAFGELKLRTAGALPADAAQRLSTIAEARGFSPEETAKTFEGLARGNKQAYEALTGRDADLALQRYAATVGTTADRLTDLEKAQALTNDALSHSAEFTDLAEARARSLDAHWKQLGNTAKDLATLVAELYVGTSLYDPRLLGDVGAQVQSSPSFAASIVRGALGINFAPAAPPPSAPQNQGASNDVLLKALQQSSLREEQDRIARLQRSFREVPESAGRGLTTTERQQAELERARAQREALQAEYEVFQQTRSKLDPTAAKQLDDQFRDQLQSLTDSIRQQSQAAADALAQAVKTTRDAARSFFADAAIKSDRDNPFVSLFTRGRLEIEETRKTFRAFGSDFAEQMVRMRQAEIDQEAAVIRLQTRLSSLRSEQEARRLERSEGLALTGPEERALAVRGAQASAAANVPQLLAEAAGLTRGRALGSLGDLNSILSQEAQARLALQFERDPARRAQLQQQSREAERQFRSPATDLRPLQVLFEELRRLEALRTESGGRLGDATRDTLNQQLLRLTAQIDPRVLATDPRFARLRDLRARSLAEEAQRFEREVRDQRAREEVGNLAQRDARELLQAVRQAQGLTRDEQLKQFLAVTGQLSGPELTPELRQARIGFLRESATRDSQREQRADQLTAALFGADGRGGILGRLDRVITDKGIRLDGETAKIQVDVRDPSGRVNVTGPGF